MVEAADCGSYRQITPLLVFIQPALCNADLSHLQRQFEAHDVIIFSIQSPIEAQLPIFSTYGCTKLTAQTDLLKKERNKIPIPEKYRREGFMPPYPSQNRT